MSDSHDNNDDDAAKAYAEFESLRSTNPFLATSHYLGRRDLIERGRALQARASETTTPTNGPLTEDEVSRLGQLSDAEVRAIATFESYWQVKLTNPFVAARIRLGRADEFYRGQRLVERARGK